MPDGKHGEPDQNQLKALAKGLINDQSTMTLATCKENVAWAAPVYYVFLKSAFYFFPIPRRGTSSNPWKAVRLPERSMGLQ
ncbi:MAG: hypothetical protein GY846_27080 [Deltaproteobacteria bacterium]|nr:hypothetical protein [Deltaproteobacteria bacterium]